LARMGPDRRSAAGTALTTDCPIRTVPLRGRLRPLESWRALLLRLSLRGWEFCWYPNRPNTCMVRESRER
jgi:hypothetical protein